MRRSRLNWRGEIGLLQWTGLASQTTTTTILTQSAPILSSQTSQAFRLLLADQELNRTSLSQREAAPMNNNTQVRLKCRLIKAPCCRTRTLYPRPGNRKRMKSSKAHVVITKGKSCLTSISFQPVRVVFSGNRRETMKSLGPSFSTPLPLQSVIRPC